MIKYIINRVRRWQLKRAVKRLHSLGLIELSPDRQSILGVTQQGRMVLVHLRKFKNTESK